MMIGSYERIADKLLRTLPKAKRFCQFSDGKLHCGTQSLHRTKEARVWRLFWRLKQNRI